MVFDAPGVPASRPSEAAAKGHCRRRDQGRPQRPQGRDRWQHRRGRNRPAISGSTARSAWCKGQNNLIIAEHKSAAEGHRLMYEKINRIDVIEAALNRIEPQVDKHEEKHNLAAGAVWLGKTLWALGSGAAGVWP